MTATRWLQVTDLFHAALKHEGPARRAFLLEKTGGDADLLREVESLLASHARSEGFLEEPAWGVAAELILDPPAPSLAGRDVGIYHVVRELGRGGMGVVYAAEDTRLGRPVALKALTPEFTRDPVRRERLTREARAAAALSHTSIATVFALEEIDGDLYIVSEFVPGQTLREELRGGPLPADRLLPTLLDIAAGLVAAHDRGVVHRDLKPENVMRRTDGQIKVLDFGLARMTASSQEPTRPNLTMPGLALGTPGYMAPEQLAGGNVDARTDVFAFGVLAWELATGENPFGSDPASRLARMTELMEGRSAVLSRPLPLPGLDRIARRCMRGQPSDRYQASADLLADLRAVAEPLRRPARGPVTHDTQWWWRFHQGMIASLTCVMPLAAWFVRAWMQPYGNGLFFGALALAVLAVTLRLNLWFTSTVNRDHLRDQHRRLYPAIVIADGLLAGAMLAGAARLVGQHDAVAALLLGLGVFSLASLSLIEPATTRAAGLGR